MRFLPKSILISRRSLSAATGRVPSPSPIRTNAKPWLFAGLGNPGEKYRSTRHNVIPVPVSYQIYSKRNAVIRSLFRCSFEMQVGFDMIDAFATSAGISMNSMHCKALFGEGLVGDSPVLLAKPQTYMNLSGESVGPLAAYYKLPLDRVVVIFDDMDLPCGVLRIQSQGGHARHKGLVNVIRHFRGNREFARLRIGIGKPPGQMDPKAFVLQKFNASGRERIDSALQEGVGLLKTIVAKGLTACASSANTEQKYKHFKTQVPTA